MSIRNRNSCMGILKRYSRMHGRQEEDIVDNEEVIGLYALFQIVSFNVTSDNDHE